MSEPPPSARSRIDRARPYAWLVLSAVLMFLGFAGFGVWPLGFIGIVPALYVFDPRQTHGGFDRPGGARFFRRALFWGYVAEAGGFYWLVDTLLEFSGFPFVVCVLFGSIFFLYQGLQFVIIAALTARAQRHGFATAAALPAAYLATEHAFPMLFEHYYGNATHPVPLLMQVADLGGPMMCTLLFALTAGAIYDVIFARLRAAPLPRASVAAAAAYLLFAIVYGAYRLHEVPQRAEGADTLDIGVVQADIGLAEKWADPEGGVRVHAELTRQLEAEGPLDLVVWPESAVSYFLPYAIEDLDHWGPARPLGLRDARSPLLFGALRARRRGGGERPVEHNTAFLADAEGRILGAYDKIYLLAFGEFLPFGDTFPWMYEVSPMSGRFSPGESVEPVVLGEHRIGVLICYEDIVSSFVRRVVREGHPDVLVNVTNDSWFGDTHEPWVHLALARFRAIEHRRWLVRATNTGVSALIDPLGRVVAQTHTFEPETLRGRVAMLRGGETLYDALGPWPGYVSLLAIVAMVWRRRGASGDAPRSR